MQTYSGSWYYKHTVPSNGSCSSNAVNTSSVNLASLSSNTSYTFKAYSNSGCSTELAAASAFLTKPGKPTKPNVTVGAGSGKLILASTVSGSGTLTKWQYVKKEGSGQFETTSTNISSTSTTLSYTVTGLTDGTSYQFKVRAVNATGSGAASDASASKQAKDETLAASSVGHDSATLTIGNYTGSWYYKYTSPAGGSCSTNSVSTASTDLSSLAGNTSYTFKAYSDSGCSTELAAASAFLTKPAKPSKPNVAAGGGSGKLTVASSVTGGSGALARWQYTKDDGSNWTNVSVTATTLSKVVTGLTNGTEYTFKVRAVNATGTGRPPTPPMRWRPSTRP